MVLGHFFLHIRLGCGSVWFDFLLDAWSVGQLSGTALVWSDDWSVPNENSVFFLSSLVLFVILLSLQSPSLSLSSWIPSFPLSLFSQHHESSDHSSGFHPQPLPLATLALDLTSQLTLHPFGFSRNQPFRRQCTLCIFFQGRKGCFYVMLNIPLDWKYHGFLIIYLGISKPTKSTNLHQFDKLCAYQMRQTIPYINTRVHS